MSHLEQRIRYMQQRHRDRLDAMRRAFQLREEIEAAIRAERHAKITSLAERREQWRREREAAAEEELRKRFADGSIQEAAFTFDEVKAFNPCGRAEQVRDILHGNGVYWSSERKIDLLTAINAGATYGDVVWIFHSVSRVNPQAKQLWLGFKKLVKGDDYSVDNTTRLDILRNMLTTPQAYAMMQNDTEAIQE